MARKYWFGSFVIQSDEELHEGDAVTFELAEGPKGLYATKVGKA